MIETCGQSSESSSPRSGTTSSTPSAAPLDPGAALAKLQTKFQEMCYGIPIDLIAQWCCVDLKTARHYKSGARAPGKSALVLFVLHANGLVLPAEWQGFSFRGGTLWDPSGRPLTHGMLRAYELGIQVMREWARGDDIRTRTLDEIFHEAHATLLPPASAAQRQRSAGAGGEAKPSALVLQPEPETVRKRTLRPTPKRARAPASETGSTKVDGRAQRGMGNAKRQADPFGMLSPHLRFAANAQAK